MGLKLNDFMSEIRSTGIQRGSRYLVEITPPKGLNLQGPIVSAITDLLAPVGSPIVSIVNGAMSTGRMRQLGLRCAAATFPGIQLMTKDDIQRYGVGPVDKTVHNAIFSDFGGQFILDAQGLVLDFFYKWQQLCINTDSSDTMNERTQGATPYEVSYKDDYSTFVKITQYDERGKRVISCTTQKAFPISVGDIQHGWDQVDSAAFLPVTFSYRDHKIKKY